MIGPEVIIYVAMGESSRVCPVCSTPKGCLIIHIWMYNSKYSTRFLICHHNKHCFVRVNWELSLSRAVSLLRSMTRSTSSTALLICDQQMIAWMIHLWAFSYLWNQSSKECSKSNTWKCRLLVSMVTSEVTRNNKSLKVYLGTIYISYRQQFILVHC